MDKLKVIHIIYAGLGGHGNVVFPLLESSFGKKHENVLVFFGIEEVIPTYKTQCEDLGIPYHSILKKPRRYIDAFQRFNKLLKEHQPDRILVHSSELIVPAVSYRKKNTGVKVFYVEHENNASKGLSLKLLSKYALRKADAVVCLSEHYERELREQFKRKVPTVVIPNGINTEKFAPSKEKETTSFIFGMASRMIPGKDHITLLNAFKQVVKKHPQALLHIAGDGETFTATQELNKTLDLTANVKFLGLLSEKQMCAFYETLSAYVLATRSETLSTAILQAMSCELPVITSDIKNNAQLITDGDTGYLYTDFNVDSLAEKLIQTITETETALQIAKKARKHVIANYSHENMANKYANLIR